MKVINARNVNDAYAKSFLLLRDNGIVRPSRTGSVLETDFPVTTVYEHPEECILWDPGKDINPFSHLMESLWTLAGRDDVVYISYFDETALNRSDDGVRLHGAYGARWRGWFGYDQLECAITSLRMDKMTRRALICMWSPNGDLIEDDNGVGGPTSEDIPHDISVSFSCRRGVLDMTVYSRSSEIMLGCYGASAAYFSLLQQYVAVRVRMPIGKCYRISNNWHLTCSEWSKMGCYPVLDIEADEYLESPRKGTSGALVIGLWAQVNTENPKSLYEDVRGFVNNGPDCCMPTEPHTNEFLANVAVPMREIWHHWKHKQFDAAFKILSDAEKKYELQVDWFLAARRWMERKQV